MESPKERMVRERAEKIFEEIIAESFTNLMKTVNNRSKKLSQPQAHTYTKKRRKKKKKNCTKVQHKSNFLKSVIKRNYECIQNKNHMYIGVRIACRQISSLKQCKPEDSETTSLKC